MPSDHIRRSHLPHDLLRDAEDGVRAASQVEDCEPHMQSGRDRYKRLQKNVFVNVFKRTHHHTKKCPYTTSHNFDNNAGSGADSAKGTALRGAAAAGTLPLPNVLDVRDLSLDNFSGPAPWLALDVLAFLEALRGLRP